jgi:hypothetical protein
MFLDDAPEVAKILEKLIGGSEVRCHVATIPLPGVYSLRLI